MADNYMISRTDLLRLVALLQRRSIGVKYAGNRLRVTEASAGSYAVSYTHLTLPTNSRV